ncbi:hypothetical protein HPG69_016977 [Diceros bicornis minor]|uniref:Uncharacterized protein n=1 Tax=Diceros bicornis minor TaxID=77932 RepID=A0A7J7EC03_DICBM|nr:hypothetical protein HPG69_016977 [Diceros bicornis minor]
MYNVNYEIINDKRLSGKYTVLILPFILYLMQKGICDVQGGGSQWRLDLVGLHALSVTRGLEF